MAKKSQGMAGRHATPKKSQRKPRQVLHPAPHFSMAPRHEATGEESRPVAAPSPSTTRRFRSTIQVLSTDYHYVREDLKRILITSALITVVMVSLTFVIK